MERPNIGYLCLLFNPYQLISLYACFWIKYFLNLTRPLFDSQKHQQLCKMAKCLGHCQKLKQWDYPWSLMIKVTKVKSLLRNYWWTKCRLESCRSLSQLGTFGHHLSWTQFSWMQLLISLDFFVLNLKN